MSAQDNTIPSGDYSDNDYTSRPNQNQIPVQNDNAPVEDPIDPNKADSDEILAADEDEIVNNKSNMIDQRTRGAGKPKGAYAEPGDDEGLPGPEDGTSAVRG